MGRDRGARRRADAASLNPRIPGAGWACATCPGLASRRAWLTRMAMSVSDPRVGARDGDDGRQIVAVWTLCLPPDPPGRKWPPADNGW